MIQLSEETAEALRMLWKRSLIAVPFFGTGVYLLLQFSVISVFCVLPLLIGGILMARPLNELVFSRIGGVIFPRFSSKKPFLAFSIPEARVMQGEYEEALELYREMVKQSPDTLEVYTAIIRLTSRKMQDETLTREAFSDGLRNLSDQKDRERLSWEYRDAISRLRMKSTIDHDIRSGN